MPKVLFYADTDCFVCRAGVYLCSIPEDSEVEINLPPGAHILTFFSEYFGAGVTTELVLDLKDSQDCEEEVYLRDRSIALEHFFCDEVPEDNLVLLESGSYTRDGTILFEGSNSDKRVLKLDERCLIIHNSAFFWDEINYDMRQIVLPDNLKAIGSHAFSSLVFVKELFLPDSVLTIRRGAFHGWFGIEEIELSSQLRVIPERAFEVCTIKHLDIPEAVLFVRERAFYLCRDLEWVRFNGRPVSIAEDAFDECTSLSRISVQKGDAPYFRTILPKWLHSILIEVGTH